MKKFYVSLCIAIASLTQLQAQAPQGFNYQATVRNSSGDLIVNSNVYFKFNIIQGSQTAVPVFTETHYVSTDDLGQVNLVIGQGTANTGVFSELDWSLGSYYLGIELDTGSGYVAMGTTQLLSVPYALYAKNSGNSTPTTPNLETVLAENNSANNQQIKDLQDPTDAQDATTKAYIDALIANLQSQIDQSCEYNLITLETTGITSSSATLNGTISIDEENCEFLITEQGFVYSTEVQPTIADTQVNVNGTEVTTTIENLEPNTTYYARTFLTNNDGEFYGNEVSFMTEIRLDFSTAFTFESNSIYDLGATGMIGSSEDNSLFIAMREQDLNSEKILKVNLATNNITEKIFDQNQYVTKRLHIRGNQLIVIGGQNVNTYNLDLSGDDPTSVFHGKYLSRFGMTVLNDNAYIIGGDFGEESEVEAKKIFRWNINTETFSEFSSMAETRYSADGTIVNDNLYVFGGTSQFGDRFTALTNACKININNPSNVETFEIEKAIEVAFVRRFQNLIYVAGQTSTIDENDQISAVNPIIAVYNTSDNTYQELNTNLTNTSGFDTIHQMCIVNGKIYIIYGSPGNGGQWEVLVSDLP